MPEFEPPAFAPTADASVCHRQGAGAVQLGADPRRRDRLGAQLEPAFHGHAAGASRPRDGPGGVLAASVHRQGAAPAGAATSYGFRYAAIRRPIKNAGDKDYVAHHDVRRAYHRADSAQQRATASSTSTCRWTNAHDVLFHRVERLGTRASTRRPSASSVTRASGVDLDAHYRRVRTRDNNYLQDRQEMKLGDYTGIPGIPNQDMAMWETMGPIADRSRSASAPATSPSCSSAA